jgi:hypothetical protein
MTRVRVALITLAGVVAVLTLAAAQQPLALAQAQPGMWEISGAPGASAAVRQCVTDVALLARFEHRSKMCNATMLRESTTSLTVNYSCAAAGFGRSEIDVITPRSLRISTQGISDGLPFNYVLQARRVDDCAKGTVSLRH